MHAHQDSLGFFGLSPRWQRQRQRLRRAHQDSIDIFAQMSSFSFVWVGFTGGISLDILREKCKWKISHCHWPGLPWMSSFSIVCLLDLLVASVPVERHISGRTTLLDLVIISKLGKSKKNDFAGLKGGIKRTWWCCSCKTTHICNSMRHQKLHNRPS